MIAAAAMAKPGHRDAADLPRDQPPELAPEPSSNVPAFPARLFAKDVQPDTFKGHTVTLQLVGVEYSGSMTSFSWMILHS
jgi:hypothetical protein